MERVLNCHCVETPFKCAQHQSISVELTLGGVNAMHICETDLSHAASSHVKGPRLEGSNKNPYCRLALQNALFGSADMIIIW